MGVGMKSLVVVTASHVVVVASPVVVVVVVSSPLVAVNSLAVVHVASPVVVVVVVVVTLQIPACYACISNAFLNYQARHKHSSKAYMYMLISWRSSVL